LSDRLINYSAAKIFDFNHGWIAAPENKKLQFREWQLW